MSLVLRLIFVVLLAAAPRWALAQAAPPPPAGGYSVDPAAVQRWRTGAHEGWRYPQAGWTVVHIEGPPRERGLQHGHLLAAEIAAYIHALSEYWSPHSPVAAWAQNRAVARRLFLKGYPSELIEEMRGIADGASAEGARVAAPGGPRRLDVLDLVTLNAANEIDTLHDALAVTPHAPAIRAVTRAAPPSLRIARQQRRPPQRCNAFVANGAATPDGQIVFGHITMYDLYPANFYNVWMEVKPSAGHRFVMQTTPGGIHSSMDYAINEAGLLLAETTLDQGPMVAGGVSLAARVRQAQQYAGSIDEAVQWLTRGDNGLCSTEWVMGDLRRNEIALLTLGAGHPVLRRSSKQEWLQGAEGFYWSDNNTKEQGARLAATRFADGRPSAVAPYVPSRRDAIWLREYRAHKGQIHLDFARRMLTLPEIVSAYGVDAKYTDARLAAGLTSWASFGPPTGVMWPPSAREAREHPAILPLIPNPWTLLEVQAPPPADGAPAARDRPDARLAVPAPAASPAAPPAAPKPVWQGTLLPASDADIWLSTAFARLERILANRPDADTPRAQALDDQAVELSYYRALYTLAARAAPERSLAQTRADMGDPQGYRVAAGKGVLFLHTLRDIVGPARFDAAMRAFGRQHDGQAVSTAQFQAFLQTHTDTPLAPLFDWWMNHTGLPQLVLAEARTRAIAEGWETTVTLDGAALGAALVAPVTLQTPAGPVTQSALFDAGRPSLRIRSAQRPQQVLLDEHGITARGNGAPYTILSAEDELDQALIVYGTQDEEAANREAAQRLQASLRRREHNVQPAIVADRDVTEDEVRGRHLLLVGRPATNALSQRFADRFGVAFGPASLRVRDRVYADPRSAVLAAAENPENPRRVLVLVLVAGLGSLGTWQAAGRFADEQLTHAPVVVLPHGRPPEELVPPLPAQAVRPAER